MVKVSPTTRKLMTDHQGMAKFDPKVMVGTIQDIVIY